MAFINRCFVNNFCRWCSIFVAALLLGSCSSTENVSKAEGQIPHFRQLMTERQFAQIYAETSDDFKKVTTAKDFIDLLAAVDRKLGAVKDTTKNGWNLNYYPSGTFVTLRFKTQFERGSGEETFTYRVGDGKALLVGYHITSNGLIAN